MTDSNPQTPENTRETPFRWTGKTKDELKEAYEERIVPALRADGHDPYTHQPTHQWIRDNGFRSLLYALRENHNLTLTGFCDTVLDAEPHDDAYDWGITHDETIELLEAYLNSLKTRGELADSSVQTLRYRLATYVRSYSTVNGTDDLTTPVKKESEIPAYEAVDACWGAFDRIHDRYDSGHTKQRIHRAVTNWYAHLVRRKRAAINPADGVENEYNWDDNNDKDNPRLAPEHIQALINAAATPEDQLMITALAAWGLRPNEVASLHRSQITRVAEEDTPYVAFDERKNGPGEVSILYGMSVYEDRIAELIEEETEWNGYLFPSSGSSSGHITRQTVLNRFDRLADAAGLPETIDGVKPVPKMARRYWYDAYSTVLDNVLEGVDEIAAEQGSSDAGVVLRNYLSDERRREIRREQMRNRLSAAFE